MKRGNQARRPTSGAHLIIILNIINPDKQMPSIGKSRDSRIMANFSIGKLAIFKIGSKINDYNNTNKIEALRLNRSILALSNCIECLVDNSKLQKSFVPYRDSK